MPSTWVSWANLSYIAFILSWIVNMLSSLAPLGQTSALLDNHPSCLQPLIVKLSLSLLQKKSVFNPVPSLGHTFLGRENICSLIFTCKCVQIILNYMHHSILFLFSITARQTPFRISFLSGLFSIHSLIIIILSKHIDLQK